MGTISDKLTYLNTTKGKIKDAINLTNANILSEDTFRSYAEKLKLGLVDIINNGTDDLYDSFPKTTGTGTEITLNDTYEAPMDIGLNGNTHQDSYTGKNLFDKDNITYGYIANNGNLANDDSHRNALSDYIEIKPNTNYIFSANTKMNGLNVAFFDNEKQFTTRKMGQQASSNIFNSGNNSYIRVWCNFDGTNATTPDVIESKEVQLEEGLTATPYEPYVGGSQSPSSDYPQPIEVVTGDNTINVHGKNLLPNSESLSNTGQYQDVIRFTDLEPSTEYTLKVKGTAGDKFYTGGSMPYSALTIPSNGVLEFTFTTNSTISDLAIIKNTTATNTLPLTECTLCKGSTATYEPYQSKDYEINLGDIELCKIGDYQDYIYKDNGKWYKHSEIGKVVLDGSESWNAGNPSNRYNLVINSQTIASIKPLSNYFIGAIANPTINDNAVFLQNLDSSTLRINLYNTSYLSNLSGFKQWLSTHNTTVYYPLATPTYEIITNETLISQLEELKKAKSVDDKTFISQINEQLPFILDVSALSKN